MGSPSAAFLYSEITVSISCATPSMEHTFVSTTPRGKIATAPIFMRLPEEDLDDEADADVDDDEDDFPAEVLRFIEIIYQHLSVQ